MNFAMNTPKLVFVSIVLIVFLFIKYLLVLLTLCTNKTEIKGGLQYTNKKQDEIIIYIHPGV